MSTHQSDNRSNIFLIKENNHNLMSICYFSLLLMTVFSVFIITLILGYYSASIYLFVILFFLIIKLFLQIKVIMNFHSLTLKIDEGNFSHYITKSWMRKRNSTIWFGFLSLFFTFFMIVLTSSMFRIYDENSRFICSLIIIVSGIFISLITMYANMQIIDSYLKYSERKLPLSSVEWEQINKDYSVTYKTIFIYSVHILIIIPLLLLIFPGYRNWIKKIIQN